MGLDFTGNLCYDESMNQHKHLFQMEGPTWACFGHDDACGLRAPSCFVPVWDSLTKKGQIDYIMVESLAPAHNW